MFKLAQNTINLMSATLLVIYASLSVISTCYASPSVPLLSGSVENDGESDDGMTNEMKECPEAYRRYKDMEQAYHRPQMWRGCNGAYEVDDKKKQEPQQECPDSYQQFTDAGAQEWKGCNQVYVPEGVKQKAPQLECPDIYLQYEEMQQKTDRPQVWEGCDGDYVMGKPEKTHKEKPLDFMVVSYFKENNDDGDYVTGIGNLYMTQDGFMFGLKAESISSTKLVDDSKEDTIYSLYGFVGWAMNQPISPYLEVGFDLGDVLVSAIDAKLREELDTNECVLTVQTGVCDTIDYYLAFGIQNRPKKYNPFIRTYAKWYFLSEDGQDVYLPVLGVSVGMAF